MIVVSDANILIDLAKVGLAERFADLGFDIRVPDLVWFEVREPDSAAFVEGFFSKRLKIREFNSVELAAIQELGRIYRALSLQDCS